MARIGPGDVTLTMADLRVVTRFAAECAAEALPPFDAPDDGRPRAALAAAWAFADGAERSRLQRVTAVDAARAAKDAHTPAGRHAALAAADAAASAYLHPLAKATQVGPSCARQPTPSSWPTATRPAAATRSSTVPGGARHRSWSTSCAATRARRPAAAASPR